MLQIPIFHVNGEDPEAVAQVVRLAMDFRARVSARRGHRHVLLPPPRPQRRGRAGIHAAAAVSSHRAAQERARRLTWNTCWARRHHARRGRSDCRRSSRSELETELSRRQERRLCSTSRRSRRHLEGLHRRSRSATSPKSTPASRASNLRAAADPVTRMPARLSSASEDRTAARQSRGNGATASEPLDWAAAEALAFASLGRRRTSQCG